MWFELSKGWIGLEPSELMIRPVNRLVSHDQNGSQIFFIFLKFFSIKMTFFFVCKLPQPCSLSALHVSNYTMSEQLTSPESLPLHVNKEPIGFQIFHVNLAIYLFFPFLIQTIPIFSPHNRPLLSIKYIITCIPCYYLIYEMNRNWNKFIFKIKI